MKKLFDETHEYSKSDLRRTIWYMIETVDDAIRYIFSEPDEYGAETIIPADFSRLAKALKELTDADLSVVSEAETSETHWIFYTGRVDGDAIMDSVRFTICVRLKDGKYECNINVSDFLFASSFDHVLQIKTAVEECLNK